MDTRPDWDILFLGVAKLISRRATCNRAKHGCVLVKDNDILSIGYNGSPPKTKHCTEDGCVMINNHCERCNHAEVNSICRAAIKGASVNGAIAYVTGEPCLECIRVLACAKISRIVYIKDGHYKYPKEEEDLRKLFIEQSDIKIEGVEFDIFRDIR